MLSANEIRSLFLNFFASKQHKVIKSDSLVPKDDPTVLFTTAGMQQFKRQFLGYLDGYSRAATSQKCLRTDDLDRVGNTAFHHTFFEMLGNFSFGDYFKRDAIHWAWEFLTQVVHIPPEKLWVSVYKEDSEAEKIWLEEIKIPRERLVKLGDKSNFWPSNARQNGPNGPCGPCSEIFYDYGHNPNCKNPDCNPDCDCGRFAEIWNLVFTQFNRKDGGVLDPLPAKNIDTGMGLERLTAVLQGKKSNFDTDLFMPIREAVDREIKESASIATKEKLIIADHIRAVVFSIADGVLPSNKERGSVVKRLIIDSANIAFNAGVNAPVIWKLVPAVVRVMKSQYPEIEPKADEIAVTIKKIEEAFLSVRQQRIPELRAIPLAKLSSEERGEIYFRFHDTYGLPLSTILSVSRSQGVKEETIAQDLIGYEKLMKEQQDRSRATSKMAGDVFTDTEMKLNVAKTKFLGYETMSSSAVVLKLFSQNHEIDKASVGAEVICVLDQTSCYAEAGGQVGDRGVIVGKSGSIKITDVQKISDVYLHTGVVEKGEIAVGETVAATVDQERRLAIMRNHTATHLLQAALRTVLGPHVQQQGSFVDEERLRFDFSHPKALTHDEIRRIEDYVNARILNCDPVTKEAMSIDEAKAKGALAFFAEKYGDEVRMVSVGNYSRELCGGTHLNSTGQIGLLKIVGESAIAQGMRRIEAKTGTGALAILNQYEDLLKSIAQTFKSPVEELRERLEGQANKLKAMEKELEKYRFDMLKGRIDEIVAKSPVLGGARLVNEKFTDLDIGLLRKAADLIKQKAGSAVVILAAVNADNGQILMTVTDDLVKKGIKADEVIREVANQIGGSGGGRPQMAQAGSKDASGVDAALTYAKEVVTKKLSA